MDGKFQTAHTKEESTMTILTNTTDRKALARAIAEELHTEARYLRTPTYAYEVGDFTVDRDGNIIGENITPLMGFLLRNSPPSTPAFVSSPRPSPVFHWEFTK